MTWREAGQACSCSTQKPWIQCIVTLVSLTCRVCSLSDEAITHSVQEFKTIPSATLILFNGYECYVGSKVSPVVTASVIGHCYMVPMVMGFPQCADLKVQPKMGMPNFDLTHC